VFGIEGGSWIPYMEAMRTEGIEFVLTANEASAGIMADVSWRLTGIPGVCYATYGPGATNLSTGVGCAYLDRSAVIALTSEFDLRLSEKRMQMNIDHQQLFRGITKKTIRLDIEDIDNGIDQAFRTASDEVPGPVHIGIAPAGRAAPQKETDDFRDLKRPEREKTDLLKKLLSESEKPVIAAGLTAFRLGLGNKLMKMASRHNMPVLLTPMAKGLVPMDHPWYAGVLFHAMSRQLKEVYSMADLVVGIGYDPVEFCFEDWMPDATLVNIDTVPADTDDSVRLGLDITGDPGGVLESMISLEPLKTGWDRSRIKTVKEGITKPHLLKDGSLGPVSALQILREQLPADGILTCDVGAHTHLIGQIWDVTESGRLIMTNGWSSMGFGIPSAIAAKLVLPDRKVVCVTGDGGFLMMAGELVTARRLKLPLVFVILADRELGLIRIKQDLREVPRYGINLYDGELIHEPTFLGLPVFRARTREEYAAALKSALDTAGPAVVEAVINGDGYNGLITGEFK